MHPEDTIGHSNALLEAIYGAALEPERAKALLQHMLKDFREDLPVLYRSRGMLEAIVEHLNRALRIADCQEQLRWERQQVSHVLDRISPAICVVQCDRTIVGMNPAAKRHLGAVVGARLGATWTHANHIQQLEDALGAAQAGGYGCACFPEGALGEAHVLHVRKLPSRSSVLLTVVLLPQEAIFRDALRRFAEDFRLTDKEHRILQQVMRQSRLDHVAEAEQVAYHTVRQHLNAIYSKTGASSQAELASSLLQHIIVQEAIQTQDAGLLPHVRALAQSHFISVRDCRGSRQLCYAEHGDPYGTPIVYFHSMNGSRLELFLHDELFKSRGIRLVAVDRPGYGHSDGAAHSTYLDYASDVRQLLDALDLERVTLLSYSAGTASALACAAMLSGRIAQVHCTASVPPPKYILASPSKTALNSTLSRLLRVAPALLQPSLELALRGQTVESLYRNMVDRPVDPFGLQPRDMAFVSQPEHLDYFIASTIEALRQGPKALAKDAAKTQADWTLPFERTRCPVRFWHGDADTLATEDMVAAFAKEFPRADVNLIEGETHLLIHRQMHTIIDEIQRMHT